MRLALRQARGGRGRTSPNPMVGAVVVKDGRVVAQGYHQCAGAPHAEAVALQKAGSAARGADLYVNLEPCNHHGRTPPCTEAILASGLRRVIIGMSDPNPRVRGGGCARLKAAGLEVVEGVLGEASHRLNEAFTKFITTGSPFVSLKCAATLDGRIATHTGDSKWITSEKSRGYVHWLRNDHDAILTGIGTVLADDPRLTTRLKGRKGVDPLRVVLDSQARLPADASILHSGSRAKTLVAATYRAPRARVKALRQAGAEVRVFPARQGRVDLRAVFEELGNRSVLSVLVEAGSEINGAVLEGGWVDKVYAFVAPKIVGGVKALPAVGGKGAARMSDALLLEKLNIRRMDRDVLFTGYLNKCLPD